MPVISTQKSAGGGTSSEEFTPLPSDVYHMRVVEVKIEENQFAEPKRDGTKPEQLVLTWEIVRLTDDQAEEGAREDALVWQRLNPYYGPIRDGGDSRFKQFIDALQKQGLVPDFDAEAFDTDALLDIEQRVTVECYTKSMGPNVGKLGNKVGAILPLRRSKAAAAPPVASRQPVLEAEDTIPF